MNVNRIEKLKDLEAIVPINNMAVESKFETADTMKVCSKTSSNGSKLTALLHMRFMFMKWMNMWLVGSV